ncbi:MAG: type II toxin-antitoxin system VapC family toxin [Deltaproteobacteria bacterium]|nr:type II toxin-antitoxin system VapC family toxin [Deltaproteobacteria bacterium]
MTYLLDTHILVWWWADDAALPSAFAERLDAAIAQGEPVAVSCISFWEIAMLVERGRLQLAAPVDAFLGEVEAHPAMRVLPISAAVAVESTRLGPSYPRDPADRIIPAARGKALGIVLDANRSALDERAGLLDAPVRPERQHRRLRRERALARAGTLICASTARHGRQGERRERGELVSHGRTS